ncbi:MAG TPA: acyl-CoA desaturase [Thermoanaerobaculia bacterium]|nr:acyl-CoA desaturase [Thermoanaerobaculia bacterium]
MSLAPSAVPGPRRSLPARLLLSLVAWFDSHAVRVDVDEPARQVDWVRVMPFVAVHLAALGGPLLVGWSWTAVGVAVFLYLARMFAITGFYHRYFSHRSYRTSRPVQLAFAVAGASAAQRGPLWWAAHHRLHHLHADGPEDVHSPHTHGLWWSHMGWITSRRNFPTRLSAVPDLARYPELRFLDRFDTLVPFLLGGALFATGAALERWAPGLGTSGPQLLVWGFFVSTVVLFHGTCLINSAAHLFGRRRYETDDHSRNSLPLALITLGEGWHNNHHHCQRAARQGFFWWEVDVTYYLLRSMAWCGLVWDLKPVPRSALEPDLRDAA